MINLAIYGTLVIKIFDENVAVLWRSKIWLNFNFYFAVVLTVFIIVTGSFYEENSKLLLITYTSLNLYCVYMQFMFTASETKYQDLARLLPINNGELQATDSPVIEINMPEAQFEQKNYSVEEVH
jgi:hypothetical protein